MDAGDEADEDAEGRRVWSLHFRRLRLRLHPPPLKKNLPNVPLRRFRFEIPTV